MKTDYGKEAYLKTEQLLARVAALERREVLDSPYGEQSFSFRIFLKRTGLKRVKFIAGGAQKISVNLTYTTVNVTTTLKFNGEAVSISGGSASVTLSAKDGENEFVFSFTSTLNKWVDVTLTVEGFIRKKESERLLSSVGDAYYSFFDDGTFYVYKVGTSSPIVVLYDVKYASAFYGSDGLFVASINGDSQMTVQRYYTSGTLYIQVGVSGSFGKCAVRVKRGYVLAYALKGNYVWTGKIAFSGTPALSRTNLRGKEISFRSVDSTDYLLVEDYNGIVNLCELSLSDYMTVIKKKSLGKLVNPKISSNGGLTVWHNKGGVIAERRYGDNNAYEDAFLISADEAVILDTGVIVSETDGTLTIIQ